MIDSQTIIDLDRELLLFFNGSDSAFLDGWMACLTHGLTWVPLYVALLYLVIKNNESVAQILLVIECSAACVLLADVTADIIVKPLVARPRPCNEPQISEMVHFVSGLRSMDYSFFSAHAANTISIAVFFCLLVRSKVLGTTLVVWSLVNGYTRIYLGLHYPFDVLTGLAWGTAVGFLVYWLYTLLYKRLSSVNNYVSTQYTSTGYSLDDVDIVELVFFLTIIYTIIRAVIIY